MVIIERLNRFHTVQLSLNIAPFSPCLLLYLPVRTTLTLKEKTTEYTHSLIQHAIESPIVSGRKQDPQGLSNDVLV